MTALFLTIWKEPAGWQAPNGLFGKIAVQECDDLLSGAGVFRGEGGAVSRAGQAIVCVPAQVTVRVEGSRTDNADAIAGGVS